MWFILFLFRAGYLFISQLIAVSLYSDNLPEGMYWFMVILAAAIAFWWTEPEEGAQLARNYRMWKKKRGR